MPREGLLSKAGWSRDVPGIIVSVRLTALQAAPTDRGGREVRLEREAGLFAQGWVPAVPTLYSTPGGLASGAA